MSAVCASSINDAARSAQALRAHLVAGSLRLCGTRLLELGFAGRELRAGAAQIRRLSEEARAVDSPTERPASFSIFTAKLSAFSGASIWMRPGEKEMGSSMGILEFWSITMALRVFPADDVAALLPTLHCYSCERCILDAGKVEPHVSQAIPRRPCDPGGQLNGRLRQRRQRRGGGRRRRQHGRRQRRQSGR